MGAEGMTREVMNPPKVVLPSKMAVHEGRPRSGLRGRGGTRRTAAFGGVSGNARQAAGAVARGRLSIGPPTRPAGMLDQEARILETHHVGQRKERSMYTFHAIRCTLKRTSGGGGWRWS